MGFALQGLLLVRERYPSRGPYPPDVTEVRHPLPKEWKPTWAAYRVSYPRRVRAVVLRPGGRWTVDAFLGFSASKHSPHASGPSLVVTMPAFSPLGGVTSRPAWTSRPRGSHGLAGSSLSCRLSCGSAPSDRHDTPFTVPGSGLMVSPRAGSCLTGRPTALCASSDPVQPRFLGSWSGVVVHRCSTGHVVRSSALVYQSALHPLSGAPRQRREGFRKRWTKGSPRRRKKWP